MNAPRNPQPNFLKLLAANKMAKNFTLFIASFASGHAIQKALTLNVGLWPAYAVIIVVLTLGAVAAWTITDDDRKMKEFAVNLALTGIIAIVLGFLGFFIGSGWCFFMLVAVSIIAIVIMVKKDQQRLEMTRDAPADETGG